jgi:hypothetical protein
MMVQTVQVLGFSVLTLKKQKKLWMKTRALNKEFLLMKFTLAEVFLVINYRNFKADYEYL